MFGLRLGHGRGDAVGQQIFLVVIGVVERVDGEGAEGGVEGFVGLI